MSSSRSQYGPSATELLRGHPGWFLVFRVIARAVCFRGTARNGGNFDQGAPCCASSAAPFAKEASFRVDRVVREVPGGASQRGLRSPNHQPLERMIAGEDAAASVRASERMVTHSAAAGLCGVMVEHGSKRDRALPGLAAGCCGSALNPGCGFRFPFGARERQRAVGSAGGGVKGAEGHLAIRRSPAAAW